MPYDNKKSRKVKPIITKELCSHIKHHEGDRVYKVFFCLPSTKMLDIKAFKDAGLIRPGYTKIIAVEKKKKWRGVIGKFLTREGFPKSDRVVISKDLCDIYTWELAKACSDLGVEKIDLWYIDTCNSLVDCMQGWLEHVVGNCTSEDAVIVTNFCSPRYKAQEIKKWDHFTDCLPIAGCHNEASTPLNKNARPICNFLTVKLNAFPSMCISYKENDRATPMILTVQHKKEAVRMRDRSDKDMWINILRIEEMQNLGYKKKKATSRAMYRKLIEYCS